MDRGSGLAVAVLGVAIIIAGASVLLKPEKSTATWIYREASETIGNIPEIGDLFQGGLEKITEDPAQDDVLAKIGYYVVDVHHRIGAFDIGTADSVTEAKSIAEESGLATTLLGIFIVSIGVLITRSEDEEGQENEEVKYERKPNGKVVKSE